uniref:C2 domain-containing protein n=1 Tax=Romanomermis culicivorax TaxID=13658 RepID=A0A915L0G9_ROMCU
MIVELPLSGPLWTDFRYAVKSPNNVSPSSIVRQSGDGAVGENFLLTPPAFRRRSRGDGNGVDAVDQQPATSTASVIQNRTPEFKCVVDDAKNSDEVFDVGIDSLIDERLAFDQMPTVASGIPISSQTNIPTKNLPLSAPGSPNKKRSPSSSPSMHRVNSPSFANGQITDNCNENYTALLLFGDEEDQHQKLNRRTSVSSTESFSDENAARPLARAMSTESVDSSFSLTDYSHDTEVGQLELRLLYDRYDQLKQNATALSFHEKFHQCVREPDLRRVALLCQLYGRKSNVSPTSDMLGQVKIRLKDVQLVRINTIWLTIVPPLEYRPTLNLLQVPLRKFLSKSVLSVPIQLACMKDHQNLSEGIRVYLVHGAKVSRKKTSMKYIADGNVLFNESMIFALPQTQISDDSNLT